MDKLTNVVFWEFVGGGVLLAFNAGYINAVTLSSNYLATVTHVSGNITKAAIAVSKGEFLKACRIGGTPIFFAMGALLSAVVVGDAKWVISKKHAIALAMESIALGVGFLAMKKNLYGGEFLMALACGIQNAMCTCCSGAIIRTTHMTGYTTDIGVVFGHWLSPGIKADKWKIYVLLPVLSGYFLGGIFGSIGWNRLGLHALVVSVISTGLTSFIYLIYIAFLRHYIREDPIPVFLRIKNFFLKYIKACPCNKTSHHPWQKQHNLELSCTSSKEKQRAEDINDVEGNESLRSAPLFDPEPLQIDYLQQDFIHLHNQFEEKKSQNSLTQ